MNKIIAAIIVITVLVGTYLATQNTKTAREPILTKIAGDLEKSAHGMFGVGKMAMLYKDPNCGCCAGYAKELEQRGFSVDVVSTKDMANVKNKHGIPANKQSCHTIEIDGYVIEGHVPMSAVQKLLEEAPEISGIGLPGMPSGTPGMPGPKRAPYEVYQIKNGEFSEFVTI